MYQVNFFATKSLLPATSLAVRHTVPSRVQFINPHRHLIARDKITIKTIMNFLQSGDPPGPPTSPLQLTPVLVESQISRIAETAATLVKSLPDLEPKQPNIKKKICKELEVSTPI